MSHIIGSYAKLLLDYNSKWLAGKSSHRDVLLIFYSPRDRKLRIVITNRAYKSYTNKRNNSTFFEFVLRLMDVWMQKLMMS